MYICTGYGANDTHALILNDGRPNPHPSRGEPYQTISLDEIWLKVQNPPAQSKEQGQWIIPSSYHQFDARSHEVQRLNGLYHMMAADIDQGNFSLQDIEGVIQLALGDAIRLIYSTRSATADNKKWRILIPLAQPLSGQQYGPFQASLFDALEHCGLRLDRTLERAGQLVYLPNRGDFYQYQVSGRVMLDPHAHPMAKRAEQYLQVQQQIETGNSQRNETNRSPVAAFRRKHPIEEMLSIYGYRRNGGTNHWASPYQTTGGFATVDRGDHWISLSDSDKAAGIGKATANGSRYGDAFDLYVHYQCQGNHEQALGYARQCLQAEDNARYGEATVEHGAAIWQAIQEATAAAIAQRRQEDQEALAEATAFAEAAAQAEKDKWGGEWLKEVPFELEPNALEWAAWHAPGALGAAVRAKAPQATRRTLVPILAGAIAALCQLTQGKVVLRYKHFITPSTVMMYLAGDSASGKGDSTKMAAEMLQLIQPEHHQSILGRRVKTMASGEAVHHFLATVSPHVMIIQEESGASRAATKGSSRHESVAAELTGLFTAFMTGIEASHAKTDGKAVEAVYNPSLAALLLSTPEKLFKTIEGADAESGWLGRYLFLPLKDSPIRQDQPEIVRYPAGLIHYLNRLASLNPPPRTLNDDRVFNGVQHSFHVMRYSPEAEMFMKELEFKYDELARSNRKGKVKKNLLGRTPESISRLSFIAGLATGVDGPVQLNAVKWAEVVVSNSLEYVVSRMDHLYDGDQDDSPVAKVRKSIKDYFYRAASDEKFARSFGKDFRINENDQVELGRSKLRQKIKENIGRQINLSSKQINDELESMIQDEELVEVGKEVLTNRMWLRLEGAIMHTYTPYFKGKKLFYRARVQ